MNLERDFRIQSVGRMMICTGGLLQFVGNLADRGLSAQPNLVCESHAIWSEGLTQRAHPWSLIPLLEFRLTPLV